MPLLRTTWIAAGIAALAIAGGGVGYTVWSRHQQEPGASLSTPLPPEAPRRKDAAAIEPEISPQPLPAVVTPIRPPQPPPEVLETPPAPPDAAAIERVLSNVQCSVLEAVVRDTTWWSRVTSATTNRWPRRSSLWHEPHVAWPSPRIRPVKWTRSIAGRWKFCGRLWRPIAIATSASPSAALPRRTDVREGDKLVLTIKAPEHELPHLRGLLLARWQRGSYASEPGFEREPLSRFGAATLGNGGPSGSWTVGEPFGTELVTVTRAPSRCSPRSARKWSRRPGTWPTFGSRSPERARTREPPASPPQSRSSGRNDSRERHRRRPA